MDSSNQISALNLDDLELNDLHVADVSADSAKSLSHTTAASRAFEAGAKTLASGSGSSVW